MASEECLLTWSYYGVVEPRPLQFLFCPFLPEQNLQQHAWGSDRVLWKRYASTCFMLGIRYGACFILVSSSIQAVASEGVQTKTACLVAQGETVKCKLSFVSVPRDARQ